jgi:AraC-like DNA-binding protein
MYSATKLTSDWTALASDPLSEALETLRLRIWLAGRFELAAPWGFSVPAGLGAVYAITKGGCWLTANNGNVATPLAQGDLAAALGPTGHLLQDEGRSPVSPLRELTSCREMGQQWGLVGAGNGAQTTLVAGFLHLDGDSLHPLHAALPTAIHVKSDETNQLPWFADVLRMIIGESRSGQAGGQSVIGRLIEILLVQLVRQHLREGPDGFGGWMRAILHPEIGRAVELMRRHPEQPWTVASLAEQVAMSRSAFSAMFADITGNSPMRSLREHRMQKASRMLRERRLGLKEIASRVGYESTPAFSAAFKRWSGESPGAYRRKAVRS